LTFFPFLTHSDEARSYAGSLISLLSYSTVFVATLTFPYLANSSLDNWGTFLLYACFGLALTITAVVLVPNTRGKAPHEVMALFAVLAAPVLDHGGKEMRELDHVIKEVAGHGEEAGHDEADPHPQHHTHQRFSNVGHFSYHNEALEGDK